MRIFCIKEVRHKETVIFRKFCHYQAFVSEEMLEALNEQEEKHALFSISHPEGWEWFYEHFT